MNGTSLQQLIRHAYRNGSHSYNYAAAEVNKDDAVPCDALTDSRTSPSPEIEAPVIEAQNKNGAP
jgi:hypothetical protein